MYLVPRLALKGIGYWAAAGVSEALRPIVSQYLYPCFPLGSFKHTSVSVFFTRSILPVPALQAHEVIAQRIAISNEVAPTTLASLQY